MTITVVDYGSNTTSGSATATVTLDPGIVTTIEPGDDLWLVIYRYGASAGPDSITDNGNDAFPEDPSAFIGRAFLDVGTDHVSQWQIITENSHVIDAGSPGTTWKIDINYPDGDVGGSAILTYLVRGPHTNTGAFVGDGIDAVDMVYDHDAMISFAFAFAGDDPDTPTPTPGSWTAHSGNGDFPNDLRAALLMPAPANDYSWTPASIHVPLHANPPRTGNPRWITGGLGVQGSPYQDFAQDSDDDEVRTLTIPGNPQVGDHLLLFTTSKNGVTGDVSEFTYLQETAGTQHDLEIYVRVIDGTEPTTYTFTDVKQVALILTTMGDQVDSFAGWERFGGGGGPTVVSTAGSPLPLATGAAASPASTTPGDITFSLNVFSTKSFSPSDVNTAYPFFFVASDSGNDSTPAGGIEIDIHGPTFSDTQDWLLQINAQDDRDATVVLPTVTVDYSLDLEDISFNSLTGTASISQQVIKLYPTFSAGFVPIAASFSLSPGDRQ